MEEENEKVVEKTTQETIQKVDESKFKSAGNDNVIKVDLNAPQQEKVETEVVENKTEEKEVITEVTEKTETQPEAETQEAPVLEEITEEKTEDKANEIAIEAEEAIKEIYSFLLLSSEFRSSFNLFIVFGF